MKALYVTSLHSFSGKTAVCLALGRRMQKDGFKVGYFRPLSTQAWEPLPGKVPDEDPEFVHRILGLKEAPHDLVGVVLTPTLLRDTLCHCSDRDLLSEVKSAYERVTAGKDIVLMEGGASLREGCSVGLAPTEMAQSLDTAVLAIIRFRNEMDLMDDCLIAQQRMGDRLLGVLINAVPEHELVFVDQVARSCLEEHGVRVMGALPLQEELQAISVGELAQALDAEFLALPERENVLIEQLVVGAMSVEQALPRMRRVAGSKAVITGGDRADIQLAALETATSCLILTGQLRPQAEILRRAEQMDVPVLLVRMNTMEAVEAIERVFGKTRLGQPEKLAKFEALVDEYLDFERLYKALGLD